MQQSKYLMESEEEARRLDIKTDTSAVEKQAKWAGIKPGMRVADVGCGPGVTTSILHSLVQPGGEVVGIDFSDSRIAYAKKNYSTKGMDFIKRDFGASFEDLGKFDFVWMRFVLEYFLTDSFELLKNISRLLKPGGILCLIDLDHNCLNHYGLSGRLARTIASIMKSLEEKANFDPYAGRKLYSFLYDLNYDDIDVQIGAHHNIFGALKDADAFNWMKKIEVAPKKIDFAFEEYPGGYEEFVNEYETFFNNPRRFTYTPIICCKGLKPPES